MVRKKQTIHKNKYLLWLKSPAPFAIFAVAILGFVLTFQSSAASTMAVYPGVFAGGDSNLSDVSQFETITGKKVSIINSFSSWGASDNGLKINFLNNVRAHGSIPMITWEPWRTSDGVNQPDFTLKSINDGKHDAYIQSWAQSLKSWGHPVFLRFAHEMNGNWYPWSETVNSNSPGEYVQAWKHVHKIFNDAGANDKVTWVWCVNKLYAGSKDIGSLYPGDTFVDWTSFDAYNRGTAPGTSGNQFGSGTWQSFDALIKPTYQALNIVAPGKPQMLAEFGSVEEGGDKADWLIKALKYELKTNYPRIKAAVYFNQNKVYNNLVDTSPTSLAAYKDGIGLSYYSSNNYGNTTAKNSGITGKIFPLLFDAQPKDMTGPFVSITGPYQSKLTVNTSYNLLADAKDRSDISKVDFYIDDTLVCSIKSSAYSCSWNTPSVVGIVNIKVVAYDTFGNVSWSTSTYNIQ